MKSALIDFLKPSKIKIGVFALLFFLLFWFSGYDSMYSLGWSQNPNKIFLGVILSGPFLLLRGFGTAFLPSMLWMYLISCIFSHFYKKEKLPVTIIFLALITITSILSFNLYTFTSDHDKEIFMQALKEENLDLCEDISQLAEVNGEELRKLIDTSETKLIINVLTYIDGYNLKDQCLMMEDHIRWREWAQNNTSSNESDN